MTDWEWKVGLLQGYGECAWQERDVRIRRITVLVPNPRGGAFLVTPNTLQFMDEGVGLDEIEFDAKPLVIARKKPREKFVQDLERHWGGSRILTAGFRPGMPPPGNGPRGIA